jgi:hypothetical protein
MSKITYELLSFSILTHFRDQNKQTIQPINFTKARSKPSVINYSDFLFNYIGLFFYRISLRIDFPLCIWESRLMLSNKIFSTDLRN